MVEKNKTPTASSATENKALETAILQATNKYNKAKGGSPEQADALLEVVSLQIQKAVMEGNLEGIAVLTKLTPEIIAKLKTAQADLREDAAKKQNALELELSQKQRDLLDKQAKELFDLSMSGQKTTVSLLGMVKGIAALFKLAGVDTTELMQLCDDGMKEAQAQVTKIDYKSLGAPSRIINTADGEAKLKAGERSITSDAGDKAKYAEEIYQKVLIATGINQPASTSTSGAKESAPTIETSAAITTAAEVVKAGGNKADITKVKSAIEKSASLDGDAAHLSEKELITLNGKLMTIAGKTGAEAIMSGIKAQPTSKANIAAPELTPH